MNNNGESLYEERDVPLNDLASIIQLAENTRSLRQKYNGFYVKICKLASGTSDFQ